MTTQPHPRPSFVRGPAIFFAALAIAVSVAITATRIDWQGSDAKPTTESTALAPSVSSQAPTAQEIFDAEMALTEAQWDAAFGPMQPNVDELSRIAAEHDNAIAGTLGISAAEPSFSPLQLNVTPSDDVSRMKAEHDNAITGTLGVTESFGTSFPPAPLTEEEILATVLAEHEAWIAAYLGQ